MSYKDVVAGTKTAKPFAARFIKAKTGTLGMEVAFKFIEKKQDGSSSEERLNWVAWLSDKAIDNSLKTLVEVLGYNGNDSVDANGMLTDPNALVWDREVSLVVEIEDYTKQDGTTGQSPKIKWVNKLGGSSFGACTPESIKNDLGAMNFRAAFLAAKQVVSTTPGVASNVVPAPRSPMMPGPGALTNEADLPF